MVDFVAATGLYRRELLAHCYRMLGSVHDAEDVVQETYLRAWRAYDRFEQRSSVRTWLYRIATNACLTALEGRDRRFLPSGLRGPSDDPSAPPEAVPDVAWLSPIPDALVIQDFDDPATVSATRDSLRLALITALQHLPAKQRAVLILRDVLAFPAGEVAEMTGTSIAAVKSTLQRARARLAEVASDEPRLTGEPTDPATRALLDRYIAGFVNADLSELERALRADAALEVTGSRTWFAGLTTCLEFIRTSALGEPGDWRMVPLVANGQPAAAAYLRGDDGRHHAYGISVLSTAGTRITRITVFGDPTLVALAGFSATHPAASATASDAPSPQ
ncbi:sigma-70 family RNA polymerase sigma factor [Pseudonocardia humida]|uniref:RNA polymerase sigma factor n=1 Tax=Pseudonocardia humida TaxID=2800819 RepID=A0ABT1A9J3_9PSEU|nr:sigma-70 family RNA polymerase sigma factor [Pseudonocardia humida]MCO1659702.1 sigma-70 family RNA polymerase sigma factor [Pseudonocardia humida]